MLANTALNAVIVALKLRFNTPYEPASSIRHRPAANRIYPNYKNLLLRWLTDERSRGCSLTRAIASFNSLLLVDYQSASQQLALRQHIAVAVR